MILFPIHFICNRSYVRYIISTKNCIGNLYNNEETWIYENQQANRFQEHTWYRVIQFLTCHNLLPIILFTSCIYKYDRVETKIDCTIHGIFSDTYIYKIREKYQSATLPIMSAATDVFHKIVWQKRTPFGVCAAYMFLNLLRILIPPVEIVFFINHYDQVCMLNYRNC